jgi:predicted RNA polymerase sigma factor
MVTGRTTVEDLLRDLASQVLGLLGRRYNDFIDTEDALQEALLAATTQWPETRSAGQRARLADHRRRTAPGRHAALG